LYGEVANFVETEQFLSSNINSSAILASFAQIRGSIPLYWEQPQTWKLRPKIVTHGSLPSLSVAVKAHIMDVFIAYVLPYKRTINAITNVTVSDVYIINLIDKSGGQGKLGRWMFAALQYLMIYRSDTAAELSQRLAHESRSQQLSASDPPVRLERFPGLTNSNLTTSEVFNCPLHHVDLRRWMTEFDWSRHSSMCIAANMSAMHDVIAQYVWFDYHAKCRGGNTDALKELYSTLREYFTSKNCYFNNLKGVDDIIQSSVVRTNCVDCLDRTNVVQVT
jgi:hypothetical protein